ncbi:MAG: class I SAM-dependent methyltransferase [Bacteroidota bacterium]
MTQRSFPLLILLFAIACSAQNQSTTQEKPIETPDTGVVVKADTNYYSSGKQSYDGIGKYYMGREISQVMGHLGVSWLERPERDREEKTSLLLDNMELQAGEVVADIGAGSGYFTFRMAPKLSDGKVLAVDIQQEMLDIMAEKAKQQGISNVELIKGTEKDPRLPQGVVDKVLLVDVYHEFSYPREMMEAIVSSLSADGKVFLIEYRKEDPNVPIKPHHKMSEAQAVKEMAAVGLQLLENRTVLPRQHLMIFGKKQ